MKYAALILAATVAWTVWAETPKPSLAPVAWQLDFEFQTPQPIQVTVLGENCPKTFWYMLYKVENRTGEERGFVPDITLYTDTGQTLRSGQHVPSAVFAEIQKRHNNPLLSDQAAITGKLLQGEDQAKEGVAIWTDLDPEARAFDVFVGGLSGEHVRVQLPTPTSYVNYNEDGQPVVEARTEVVLEKTLQLHYLLPDAPGQRKYDSAKLKEKTWIMR